MATISENNCNVSMEYAEEYFDARIHSGVWVAADIASRTTALITATKLLDTLDWSGIALSADQVGAFPRCGNFYEPRLGRNISMNPIPTRVKDATCELALHLLTNDDLLESSGNVLDVGVSSLYAHRIISASTFPTSVTRLINPMMVRGGKNLVWRAN